MNKKKYPRKMRGSIPWGWLITITIVVVAAGLAFLFLPRPIAPTPRPAIVTAKVPPAPPATSPPSDQQAEQQPQFATNGRPPIDRIVAADQEAAATASVATKTDSAPGTDAPAETLKSDPQAPPSKTFTPADRPGSDSGANKQMDQTSSVLASVTPSGKAPEATAETTESTSTNQQAKTPAIDTAERERARATGPSEGTSAQPSQPARQGFAIQVGAYRNKGYAETQMADLQQRGYAAYLHEVTDAEQRSFYMVRFGQFATHEAAAESVNDFMAKEKLKAVIVRAGAM